jgi:hypothetical protein
MAFSANENILLQRIENFRAGHIAEGAHTFRTMIHTLRLASAEALNAIVKGTARVTKDAIDLTNLRKTNAMTTFLATTAGTSLLGLPAAAGSVVTGTQTNNTSVTETASFVYILPQDYVAGAAITIRTRAKVSAARFVACTIKAVTKKITDGVLGADLSSAAVALTTGYTDIDHTITPTGLVPGDMLQVDITVVNNDTGGASNGTATVSEISVRPTIST